MNRSRNRRLAQTLTSQITSSLTNFALGISVARSASVDEFGAFGLIYGTVLLAATVGRSLLSEPAVVEFYKSGGDPARWDSGLLEGSLIVGLAVVPVGVGLFAVGSIQAGLAVLATLAAFMSVSQATLRTYYLGTLRQGTALLSDATWCAAQLVGVALVAAFGLGLETVYALWLAGASAGILAFWLRTRDRLRISSGLESIRRLRHLGVSWTVDSLMVNLASQAMPWILLLTVGLPAVANYRGALVLLGPTTVMFNGLRILALPALARSPADRVPRLTAQLMVLFGLVALLVGLPLVVLPDWLGEQLLGDSWIGTSGIVLAAVVWRVSFAVSTPPLLALRAIGETRSILVVRAVSTALTLSFGVAGAILGGAEGTFWGMSLAGIIVLPLWVRGLTVPRPLEQIPGV